MIPRRRLVARLRTAYLKSGGDLAQVASALIAAPEAWDPTPRKFKTPYEYLVSSYRAADVSPPRSGQGDRRAAGSARHAPLHRAPAQRLVGDGGGLGGAGRRGQAPDLGAGGSRAASRRRPRRRTRPAPSSAPASARRTLTAVSRAETRPEGLRHPAHVSGVPAPMTRPRRPARPRLTRRAALAAALGAGVGVTFLGVRAFAEDFVRRKLVVIVARGGHGRPFRRRPLRRSGLPAAPPGYRHPPAGQGAGARLHLRPAPEAEDPPRPASGRTGAPSRPPSRSRSASAPTSRRRTCLRPAAAQMYAASYRLAEPHPAGRPAGPPDPRPLHRRPRNP